MRVTRLLIPALLALAAAGCARQQASYYEVDPATRQPVAQQYAAPRYGQQRYTQAGYRQPSSASTGRGLLSSSPQLAEQAYAQAAPSPSAYRPPEASGRGLFNTYAENQFAPAYARPAYVPQHYAQQAYAQQAAARPQTPPGRGYVQQSYGPPRNPQIGPAQTQAYGEPAAYPYPQRQNGTGGPYVATAQNNPFAQARWY